MKDEHIIIIGAGAAGLMAAHQLCEQGRKVTILEARNRPGGRIHTLYDNIFSMPAELGAEFIHGNLPLTMHLLKEAGIDFHKSEGEWWQVKHGELVEDEQLVEHWKLFYKKLEALDEDQTLTNFLNEYFHEDKYAGLRTSAIAYASGYDSADPDMVSAIALREEWSNTDDEETYIPTRGYGPLVHYLEAKCKEHQCAVYTNTIVQHITWGNNQVTVTAVNGAVYRGNKVIVTIPVNLLREPAAISFSPSLPHIGAAAADIGMGAVIKILLQFSTAFWESEETAKRVGKDLNELGFLFSREAVPTWWTQYPMRTTLLTGWLGGPAAAALKDATDEHIMALAINSLANIFKLPVENIEQMITASKVANWTTDTYSKGSYAYAMVATKEARKILCTPIEDTIYFAGEALYDGPEMGTVEAALCSGRDVAAMIK